MIPGRRPFHAGARNESAIFWTAHHSGSQVLADIVAAGLAVNLAPIRRGLLDPWR